MNPNTHFDQSIKSTRLKLKVIDSFATLVRIVIASVTQDEPALDHNHPLTIRNRYWHEFFGYTPADRFLTRTKLVEMKHPPEFVGNRRKWDPLTLSIWHKFQLAQQTRQIYKTKMRLWRFIYEVTMVSATEIRSSDAARVFRPKKYFDYPLFMPSPRSNRLSIHAMVSIWSVRPSRYSARNAPTWISVCWPAPIRTLIRAWRPFIICS